MKRMVFISLLILHSLCQAQDSLIHAMQDPMTLFSEGNEAYKNEHYDEAIHSYESILAMGMESWEVHFNLGNAYFKQGSLPLAILHFEKAKKLNPDNDDLKVNLEMANARTIDKVESKPELPFSSWWNGLLNIYTIDEWGRNSIYLSFTALAFMLAFLFLRGTYKRLAFFTSLAIFGISTIFYILGTQQHSLQTNQRFAIVFSPSVTVRSAPEEDGTRLFVIHEGTKVEVLKEEGDWAQVSLMNGTKGWMLAESYKGI